MTRRRFVRLAALMLGIRAAHASQAEVSRMLRDVSRALQARNPALFLSHFDRNRFSNYRRLEANVVVLMEQKELGSSIRIVELVEEGDIFRGRVDWLLQISPLGFTGKVETRRVTIDVQAAREGKKWRMIEFAPVDFLRPD